MLFTIEALPAAEGDCLLLHWGTAMNPKLAIIDGGPRDIYDLYLRPRLVDYIERSGKAKLTIELVMVSHIDNDHIQGINRLFSELVEGSSIFQAKRLWHNAFNDIVGDGIDDYYKTFSSSFTASTGEVLPEVEAKLDKILRERAQAEEDVGEIAHDIHGLLAGHGEGRQLRINHRKLYDDRRIAALNSPFQTEEGLASLIRSGARSEVAGLTFQVVGPLHKDLLALQQNFVKFVEHNGLSAESVLAAYGDRSIPNLSSIVCLVSFGTNARLRTILLTGDARGDKIIEGLKEADLLTAGGLVVDVMKVPHHGSDNNVKPEFFERIKATHYVLSGDGLHGNPDRSTVLWIAEARGKGNDYTIYLTYPVAEIDQRRKQDNLAHGREWSESTHSLAPLLEELRINGYRFRLQAGAPLKVTLGEQAAPW